MLGRVIDAVIERGSASVDVRGTAEDIGQQRLCKCAVMTELS